MAQNSTRRHQELFNATDAKIGCTWLANEVDEDLGCQKKQISSVTTAQRECLINCQNFRQGRGALILVSSYWYPGRILRKVELGDETQWDVELWRDCSIPESNQGEFHIYNGVRESEIVDELWTDIQSQRVIQLGHWKLAINTPSKEDIIENFIETPVTKEMDRILGPHITILDELLHIDIYKVDLRKYKNVPVLHYVRRMEKYPKERSLSYI
ncbi:hypothetical protein BDQ17DRAFT_1432813 [Cyathus striatus]|nr:hypothetical protein BDQ17DRAFT_1432813 [Cyathus striatus]